MRRFTSYGPVEAHAHFGVERRDLVERCVAQLVGTPEEGAGHFFTIWAPRQTGKTWLMRRAIAAIRARYGDRFTVGALVMQAVLRADEGDEALLRNTPDLLREGFGLEPPAPASWDEWRRLFARGVGLFDRPVILLIDEFDALPPPVIDQLVQNLRKIYLARESYMLHGLALVGVRAVLGLDSPRGSPFNVQRSLHVPNLTRDEVTEMFAQYQSESGQAIDPEVVERVFAMTRGQPGLVGWFGELLTEKYNPDRTAPITLQQWERVFMLACRVEPNNTVLNLIKKARGPYREHVMRLFGKADVPFSFERDWCNYLYMNGILDFEETTSALGLPTAYCRFTSPFVQLRLHDSFTDDLVPVQPILPLDPLDTLADVFRADRGIDAPALVHRYKAFLERLKAAGKDPFAGEERRADLGLREAVGHFHLYAWLRDAVGTMCVVSPEFPTGNGKVDLLLRWQAHRAVIEVKSFRGAADVVIARRQAARYAKGESLAAATLAIFVPVRDEAVLGALSGTEVIDGVEVVTVAIGWA